METAGAASKPTLLLSNRGLSWHEKLINTINQPSPQMLSQASSLLLQAQNLSPSLYLQKHKFPSLLFHGNKSGERCLGCSKTFGTVASMNPHVPVLSFPPSQLGTSLPRIHLRLGLGSTWYPVQSCQFLPKPSQEQQVVTIRSSHGEGSRAPNSI